LRGGKEEKLLRSAPQRRAQTRETPANDNFLQFFSSSVLLQFFFSSSSSFKKVRLYCLVYLSFSVCFFRYRREMGNWRCLDQSRGRSCPLHGFLSLSFRLGRRLLRARARYMHRHIHRFDSMCAFDFNKSALELSFLVVARGFVFSWVSCCLSSLSLSFGEASLRSRGGQI
jgi:hypothetical protein